MFKRIICALLVCILGGGLFLTALRCTDPYYGADPDNAEIAEASKSAEDDNTLTLWYTDDALTDYITTEALLYQSETGVRVNPVLVSGVEYLEHINSASLADTQSEEELPPDVYLTTHDTLLRAYLAGLAVSVDESGEYLNSASYPDTALNAVTCYGNYVGYPLYYETNFFLYNKTYMESIAQNRIESEADAIEGELAQQAIDDADGNPVDTADEDQDSVNDDASEDSTDGDTEADDAGDGTDGEETDGSADEEGDPMGLEDTEVSEEVLERLSTMIPSTLDDITTFANNYDAPEAVESVFEWDVTDIFYNYFFVGNYMEVGGDAGDNTAVFNIYNQQAVDCLSVFQSMNQFFSIDADDVSYNDILDDFIQGKTVFTVATTDAIAKIEEAKAKGDFPFEYGVTVLPDISTILKARGLSVTTAVAVNGYSSKIELAEDFAKFITTQKPEDLYKKAGKISCRLNVQYDNDEISNIMEEYEKSVPLPKMVEAINYWVQLEIAFTKIWNGADPDETLKELSDTIGGQIDEIKLTLPTQESFNAGAAGIMIQ